MSMGDVEWIRITTDMFDNRKIRHLRKLPDGDKIVLIWIMLLCIAGKCNARGIIFLTENVPYTTKMLADELDFEENTVILALESLEKFGMVRHDGFLMIEDWESNQNVEGMEKIKAQNRERKRRQRERKRLPAHVQDDGSRDVSRDVTHLEEEREEDIDIISTSNEVDKSDFLQKSDVTAADMQKIVDAWNELGLRRVTKLVSGTERYIMLKKRIADYGLDKVLQAIENVRTSPFLNGNNKKGFTIVELVIVIAVIAILAGVLIPTFSGIVGNYNDGEKPKLDQRAYDGARWLAEQIAERVSGFQMPTPQELDRWATELDALHRQGYTWKQISDTAVWALGDEFWCPVIVSGAALRKNFVTLLSKRVNEND